MQLFSILDEKTAAYSRPFWSVNYETAKRGVMQECLNPDSILESHPAHFALYCLGEFDDQTGELTAYPTPIHLSSILELKMQSVSEDTQRAD